jgi:hypothetical protein
MKLGSGVCQPVIRGLAGGWFRPLPRQAGWESVAVQFTRDCRPYLPHRVAVSGSGREALALTLRVRWSLG